jgi:uncharacterized phage infection (PIP) family protein YhgE
VTSAIINFSMKLSFYIRTPFNISLAPVALQFESEHVSLFPDRYSPLSQFLFQFFPQNSFRESQINFLHIFPFIHRWQKPKSDIKMNGADPHSQSEAGPLRSAAAYQLGIPTSFARPSYSDSSDISHLKERIKQIEGSIQKLISMDLPMRLKPYDDAFSVLQSKLDSTAHVNREALQTFRDKLTEVSFSANGCAQKLTDQADRNRVVFAELKAESGKTRDVCDVMANRVGQHESRFGQIEEQIRGVSQRQQALEQSINEQFAQIARVLAQFQRNSTTANAHIMGQLDSMNRETVATFGRMKDAMQENAVALNDAVAGLAKEARDGFVVVRNETDSEIAGLRQQIEASHTNVGEVIIALQGEVVETFTAFRSVLDSSVRSLQQGFDGEVAVRRENEQRLVDATKGLASQLAGVSNQVHLVEASVQQRVDQICENYGEKWKRELALCLRDAVESVTDCRQRLRTAEERVSAVEKHEEAADREHAEFHRLIREATTSADQALRAHADNVGRQITHLGDELGRFAQRDSDGAALRFAQVETRIEQVRERLTDSLETHFAGANQKIDQVRAKTDQLEERTRQIDANAHSVGQRIQQLETRADEFSRQSKDDGRGLQTRLSHIESVVHEAAAKPDMQGPDIQYRVAKLERKIGKVAATLPGAEFTIKVEQFGQTCSDLSAKVSDIVARLALLEARWMEGPKTALDPSPALRLSDDLIARIQRMEDRILEAERQLPNKIDRFEFERKWEGLLDSIRKIELLEASRGPWPSAPRPGPGPEPQPRLLVEIGPQPECASRPDPAPAPVPEPVAESIPEPEPEPGPEPEPEPEPGPEPDPEPEAEPKLEVDPEPEAELEPEAEPEPEPEAGPEPEPEPEAEPEPEPAPEPEPEPELELDLEQRGAPEPEPEQEPEPELERPKTPELPYVIQHHGELLDVEVIDPPPGDFVLNLGEPPRVKQSGLRILRPRIFRQFIHPGPPDPETGPRVPDRGYKGWVNPRNRRLRH